jgi:hypothetical protein
MTKDLTPPIEWVKGLHPIGPDNNPAARLFGTVRILDQEFYVNAEEVVDVDDPEDSDSVIQEAFLGEGETYVEDIQAFCEGAGETVKIDGREYLLAITPRQA